MYRNESWNFSKKLANLKTWWTITTHLFTYFCNFIKVKLNSWITKFIQLTSQNLREKKKRELSNHVATGHIHAKKEMEIVK